ncbi:RE1 [Symbiodinium sp. CCMP2592]|nr:RE1 [Symbiodinium sp. CCMP2592]
MLNKLTRLQALQVTSQQTLTGLKAQMSGLGFDDDEKMALLDSGASHPFRERALHEDDGVPVRVDLAGGKSITLQQNRGGTLLPTADNADAQDVSTILPLGALVQTLGCDLTWTRKGGLKIVHPQFGVLKTVVKGNCPLIGELQALDLIHQLEQRKLRELQEATAETFIGTLCLSELKDWDEMFTAYVQTGERAHVLKALESPGCPLQNLDQGLRALLAVNLNLDDESGKGYLKALPIRRSQRKSLLTKRWIVRLFERDAETHEELKVSETNSAVIVNFSLKRSKMFNLKGESAAYRALLWAACRGQIDGILGCPPSNACMELSAKQLLLWMVAKEGARVRHKLSPYLVTTASPSSRWWTSTVWQGFQREYQLPVAQVSPVGTSESYCVATNMNLHGDDEGWGPGVDVTSSTTRKWSESFMKMIAEGIIQWRRVPEPLVLCSGQASGPAWSAEEARKWRRHVENGHLPYNKRCRTCVETAATGRSHRRVIAPSCYTLSLDLCGPFREKEETADAKGYRYALVGAYTMPRLAGYRDYKIPEEEMFEGDDDGGGVGSIPVEEEPDFLRELDEPQPEVSRDDQREMDQSNEEFQKLFKEIGDTLEYQTLHYMVPLKSRRAPEVEAAIRFLYMQVRAEGLPIQRVHSDRARELRGAGIRQWLLQHDVYPTTGEAQVPQSNGRAEHVVKMLKQRTKTMLQSASLPKSCWPLAMGHAAWAQREHALERGKTTIPFGTKVYIRAKVFGVGGKFDLNNKWDDGQFVGPSTELKGGFVVRDVNGRYLTTMHMKRDVVDVDLEVKPTPAEATLPAPMTRVKKKRAVVEGYDDYAPPPTRDSDPRSSALGPQGEAEVPNDDDAPPPTRDSDPRSSALGPLGEVVVPEMVAASGSGSHEEESSSRSPVHRLREKTRLMAMKPLSPLEQEIEDLAVTYDVDECYDEEAALRIYELLERTKLPSSRALKRRSVTASTAWTTGMYTHGGVSGLRANAKRMPSTTAFLVKAAKELTGKSEFAVVALTRGARLRCHKDSHNQASTENTVLALTEFDGGGIWVEGHGTKWREVLPGRWVQGDVHELKLGTPVLFCPRSWHETQDFKGDRVVMMNLLYHHQRNLLNHSYDYSNNAFLMMLGRWSGIRGVSLRRRDGAMLRLNEYQQQMMDEMLDRSSFLQDLLEEEEERLQDLQQLQHGCVESAKQAYGEIAQMLDGLTAKVKKEAMDRDERYYLKAVNAECDSQDYEKLLEDLQGDLQVTHTVPLQQVKPVATRWKGAIEKELTNLFQTGTLKKIKMSEARKLEAAGKLRLVPSKGVFTLKPPAEKGGRYKRKYRLVLCGNFIDPAESQGSLYAGGIGAEALRTLLAATTRRGWRGATTDITAAFLQALWPESMPMYAVLPPRLLNELEYSEDGEAWLVCRPLYGLRESPAIWATHRNQRLKTLRVPYGDGYVSLRQSTTDPEIWFVVSEREPQGELQGVIITYVDDLFYLGPPALVEKLHSWVSAEWPCSELQWASVYPGVRYLGMELFQRESGEYEVTQQGYIMDLIRAHDLLEAPQTLLPCPKEWITDAVDPENEDFKESDLRLAQRLVGEQLWLAMRCRPDIHYTVSYMSSWVSRHPLRVTKLALRVLSYLHKTAGMKMILGQPMEFPEDGLYKTSSSSKNTTATNDSSTGFRGIKLVGFSDASFAPFGDKSFGASMVTVEDSPVGWRCSKQAYVVLSVMEAELYQATEAAVLIESIGALLDELCAMTVPRKLCVDNTAALAMIKGGQGSWRTRHLKVRAAYMVQQVQDQLLEVEHVDGISQRADLSTKPHPKARLYMLLKLWRFEGLPTEAEALMVAKMTVMLCLTRALAQIPVAAAESSEGEPVKIAGVDELVFFAVLACAGAVVVWEVLKLMSRKLWACCCRAAKGRKAKRLRDMARAAAEAEVDRVLTPKPRDSMTPTPTLGVMSSTGWVPSSRNAQRRSIATQTEDWERMTPPVVVTPPRGIPAAIQNDEMYMNFDGPFYKSEYGDTVHVSQHCQGFRLASHQILSYRLCNFCSRRDPIYQRRFRDGSARRSLRFVNTG